MPRKSNKKSSSPDVSTPRVRRGRPRKTVAPEALIPFGKHEIATVKKCGELEKQPKPAGAIQKGRRMNPTTSERCYTPDEIEFMNALAVFKQTSGRLFPTCSEILGVLRSLGYEKIGKEEPQTVNA